MFTVLRHACFLVLLGSVVNADDGPLSASISDGSASTTQATTTAVRPSLNGSFTTAANATCMSRTANYITHTLPQQCLRTNWNVALNATETLDAGNSTSAIPVTAEHQSHETTITASPLVGDSDALQEVPSITGIHSAASITAPSNTSGATPTNDAVTTSSEADDAISADSESESPLDNANFLSFEEWRKKTLAKAGQSPENVGNGHGETIDRPQSGINNALELDWRGERD